MKSTVPGRFWVLFLVLLTFDIIGTQHACMAQESMQDPIPQDTLSPAADTIVPVQDEPPKSTSKKKAQDSFKIYGGVSANDLQPSEGSYESNGQAGYLLGFNYKRGRFFYYELGMRFNQHMYSLSTLTESGGPVSGGDNFRFSALDIPLHLGMNLTSAVDRILGLRIYGGLVPSFRMGVGENDAGITKSTTKSFNMLGQLGLGVDVTFLFVEAGLNYGFDDLLTDGIPSNPRQVYVVLGFRF